RPRRRARLVAELDLAARLQRHRGAPALERDQPPRLLDALPAAARQLPEQRLDRVVERRRAPVRQHRQLLVLDADAVLAARLGARLQVPPQLADAADRRRIRPEEHWGSMMVSIDSILSRSARRRANFRA